MKNTIKLLAYPFAALAATLTLSSCDVDKTAEGEAPDVDVDVKADAGKLPEYDVDGPEIKTETKKVEVPTGITVPDDDE